MGEAPPPVHVLLAALLWLCTRQHGQPTPQLTRAIALHLQHPVIHFDASIEDKRTGFRLAAHPLSAGAKRVPKKKYPIFLSRQQPNVFTRLGSQPGFRNFLWRLL